VACHRVVYLKYLGFEDKKMDIKRISRLLIGGGSMAVGLITTWIIAVRDLKKMKGRTRR
jgi:hypothetical protein